MNPRFAFVAAPLLVLAYGVIRILDGLDGSRGPGLAWTTGHLAFLAALALFVPIFWEMRRMANRDALSTVSAVMGTVGVLAASAQFVIDIVVGFLSADHAAMGVLFDRIQAVPGVSLAIYDGGPYLFYLGQLALVVQLAVIGRVKAWTPVLVLFDLVLPIVDRDFIPLGAIFLLVSFISLARGIAPTAEPVAAHAARRAVTHA
ncbi:hypothetical protein [Streptosporangium roseum]|uniref:Uncharacterized protein n=1 Tax=Streptosporangium roseum (strain ATCC 12428 / DSM 43021 / JCM 3005 / KCTC 9067 / NCIMB 10171 / NRRL 2505 / NI 9100) TaxID=479432 RepID=D2B0V1_STRRD|nr:hypothetical protein [Streptosporangium roseum]ACZ83358.1 hypothetical protein Sros_0326 [Streptosporangium roseum DSM 43021]